MYCNKCIPFPRLVKGNIGQRQDVRSQCFKVIESVLLFDLFAELDADFT